MCFSCLFGDSLWQTYKWSNGARPSAVMDALEIIEQLHSTHKFDGLYYKYKIKTSAIYNRPSWHQKKPQEKSD